ncbi:hypothetical protein [Dickeya chrysanthemi]|uniref:GIY-YIG domain-containing protein n=1 Tax=Dickeya chrysanthemi TaxID=556 RepID=A0ABU8JKU3_DICCH
MLEKTKFQPWINLTKRQDIAEKHLPGVYMIAMGETAPADCHITDESIIYIGETTRQTLSKRIHQFAVSAFNEKPGHSGGNTFRKNNKEVFGDVPETMLWVSVCPIQIDSICASAYIRYLERRQILKFVRAHGKLPRCNSK